MAGTRDRGTRKTPRFATIGHKINAARVQRQMTPTLEDLVQAAVGGDTESLDALLRAIKDDVYGLALRMLLHPADAEDATQEILLRVVTRLSTYESRARFRTWVYRVAVRALLNFRRGRAEPPSLSFEAFGEDLMEGLESGPPADLSAAERELMTREVRIACTHAMLTCLDRDHRIAYLLGVVFDLEGKEAADAMGVAPATYRKRLSRARARVEDFTRERCSLVEASAPCHCAGRIAPAVRLGRIDPQALLFADHPVTNATPDEASELATILGDACRSDSLMRANPNYLAPDRLVARIRDGL